MRFIVYGPGAIGGVVGALLAEHGQDVFLIGRGAHATAIRESGLLLESPTGRRRVRIPVSDQPPPHQDGDLVLLAMKSQDTWDALLALRRVSPSTTPVACLQNGVENERAALRLFAHVYGVCVVCPADHLEPGVVQAFSAPVTGLLDVGRYPSGTDDVSNRLATAFRGRHLRVDRADGRDALEVPQTADEPGQCRRGGVPTPGPRRDRRPGS